MLNRRSVFACLAGFVTLPRPYVVDVLCRLRGDVWVIDQDVVWGEAAYEASMKRHEECRRAAAQAADWIERTKHTLSMVPADVASKHLDECDHWVCKAIREERIFARISARHESRSESRV